ncbi:MAG: cupin domain-containing protein [Thermomicrobiales bacterium]
MLALLGRCCALGVILLALTVFPRPGAAQAEAEQGREPLIHAHILGLPSDPAIVALVRFTFAPGAVFPVVGVPGPAVFRVVEGELNVRFPGEADEIHEFGVEVTAVSPDVAPSVATPNADPHVLVVRSGEQIVIPSDVPHEIRNDGQTQAIIYAVALTTLPPLPGGLVWPPAGVGPEALPAGITAESLDTGYGVVATLPTAPVELTLDRLSLPPGAALPDRAEQALALIVVENGTLRLHGDSEIPVRQGGAGGPGMLSTPETDLLLAAGDAALVQPGTGATGRNTSDAPLVLLQLMLVPAIPPAGTPQPATPISS